MDRVHVGDRAESRQRWRQAIEHPGSELTWRIRSREAGGTYRWFEIAVANRLDDPTVGGMAMGLTDITERDDCSSSTTTSSPASRTS